MKERKGCEKPSKIPQFGDNKTGENFYRCPLSIVEPESFMFIELLNYSEDGILPFSGGVLEQPAHIINRIKCVRALRSEYMKDKKGKGK